MADKKISEATADDSVTGVEKVPVDDGGSAKFATTAQIKDYVLAQIAALTAASGVSVSDDSVYILKSGALKPVSAATLAAAIMNEAFGRAAVVGPNGNEVIAIKDSDTRKTITFTALKTWLEDNMTVTPNLTLSEAAVAGTLGDSDLALVVQAGGGKKVALGTLKDYVLGRLAAFLTAQTAAQAVTSSDVVLIVQGGNVRKATVAQLTGDGGDVKGPASTTENKIPQWDSTQKKLKDGLEIVSTLNSASENPSDNPPTDSQVPTAAAVRAAIDAAGEATGFVRKTGAETISGVKTFSSSPKVPLTPTADTDAAPKKYVDDAKGEAVLLTGDQTVAGAKTFSATPSIATPMTAGANPVVDTDDDSVKAANTSWVTAKLAAWWAAIKAAAHTISGVWTFTVSPVVPTPTNDTDAANKKYVTDNAVFKTGDQTIAGTKTFSDATALNGGATVPTGKALTITDAPSADTSAANKAYVDGAIQTAIQNLITTYGLTIPASGNEGQGE